jgi:ribosome recycling factor
MKNKIFKDSERKMKGVIDYFQKELHTLKAGRASVSMLEGINVEYYGSKMPINQLATVTTPQPQLIIIQPWDKTMTDKIKKAIQISNLGLNPVSDSNTLKVPIPPLSEERRQELVTILKRMNEEAKVEIREIRREAKEMLEKAEENKEISEDDKYKGIDQLQKLTDKNIEEIDEITSGKEKEIMEG